jgi:hypothetical protein
MEDAEGDASSVASRSLMEVGSLGKLLGRPRPVNLYMTKSSIFESIIHAENAKRVSGKCSWVERG